MSVTRVGTTKKFADNWDQIFGGRKKSAGRKDAAAKSAKKKLTAKLSVKKRQAKKKSRRQAK